MAKPPSRFKRTLKTAMLGGSVGARLVGGKIKDKVLGRDGSQERDAKSATQLAKTMLELRGPLMKVGQLIATHAEVVPEAYAEHLKPLQRSAPPMEYDVIAEVIREDLGDDPKVLFARFDEEAVAAASLGQVHRAQLHDGTEVAVKIQYPGAATSMEGDVRNMEVGAKLVKTFLADLTRSKSLDFTPVAEEIALHLMQETDYCREQFNAKLIAKLFEGDERIVIPEVFTSHSGLRTITYQFIEGEPLEDVLARRDEQTERTVLDLIHLYWHQFLRGGLLHADPHPGNFLVTTDGRLALLDYGCVKVFEESYMRGFAKMTLSRMHGDDEAHLDAMLELGLIESKDDEAGVEDMDRIASYFSVGLMAEGPFDFSEYDYGGEARALIKHFVSSRRIPPPQRHFLFLTRVTLGYYEYFSRAGTKLDFRAMVEPYLGEGFEGRVIDIPEYG